MKRFALIFAVLITTTPASAFADSTLITDIGSTNGFTQEGTNDYAESGTASVGGSSYLVVVADVTFLGLTGPPSDFLYDEAAVPSSGPYTITLTNDPLGDIDIADAGYLISPTFIPLDDLNYGLTPPMSNPPIPPFIPLPGLDGTIQGGNGIGDSLSTTITPLPSAAGMGMVALGVIGIAGLLRGKRHRA